jgi:hypothetical protein
MELLFNEQDLVDSVCVYSAAKNYTSPKSINACLTFHADLGFSATASTLDIINNLNEEELINAVTIYLRDCHNFNPDRLFVDLQFSKNEGITASVQVKGL